MMAKRKWDEFNVRVVPSIEEECSRVVEHPNPPEISNGVAGEESNLVGESTTEVEPVEAATVATTETAGEEESTAEVFWSLLARAGYTVW